MLSLSITDLELEAIAKGVTVDDLITEIILKQEIKTK